MPAVVISAPVDANCQAPRWSADGVALSYELNDHAKKVVDLYVFTPSTRASRKVVLPGAGAASSTLTSGFTVVSAERVAHEASFSPSAAHFVYSASGPANDYDLYLDTGSRVAAAPGADGNPAWSPDGQHIAFTSARTGQGDLYLLNAAALDAPPLRLTGDETASEVYAAWSPDSGSLVFVGHTARGDNIYLIDDLQFPAPRALTAWPHVQTRPVFSPDGRRIAFYSNHTSPARFDLYVMPVGGTPTLVASDVVMNARGPTWSPDGAALLFVQQDPNHLNPVRSAPWADPTRAVTLATGTVGNGDLDVVRRADGTVWLAIAAQGLGSALGVRDFMRIYLLRL